MRVLLTLLTTSAIAFGMLGAQWHEYLNIAGAMVLLYWIGNALSFIGLVLDRRGDRWFAPAALAGAIGLSTVVMATFTGGYYGLLFIISMVTMGVYS